MCLVATSREMENNRLSVGRRVMGRDLFYFHSHRARTGAARRLPLSPRIDSDIVGIPAAVLACRGTVASRDVEAASRSRLICIPSCRS